MLVDDDADEYQQLCTELLEKEGWEERFSEKHVDAALVDLIDTIRSTADLRTVEARFQALATEYADWSEENVVYVPIVGLALRVDALELGRATLRPASSDFVSKLSSRVDEILAQMLNPPEWAGPMQRQLLAESFSQWAFAEVRVLAEASRARERAEDETRRALELLRYSTMLLLPPRYPVVFGLRGDVSFGHRTVPAFAANAEKFQIGNIPVGLPSLEIDDTYVQRMAAIGVPTLSAMLTRDNPSDFEEALLRAIHWLGNSDVEPTNENKFLNLITAMEVLFTPRDRDPISTSVAEGVAFVLATTRGDWKTIKKRLKALYGKRSAVSHRGSRAILDAEVAELRSVAANVVRGLVSRTAEFATRDQLLEWIEDQKAPT
jgi:hypothetical protein